MNTASNFGLKNLKEFQSLLKDYNPSQDSIDFLASTELVLLVGPTAAGRNTLINLLLQTGRYHYIVSDTTRNKRVNNGVLEQDGVEYWFKSEDFMLEGLREGAYIEAAIIHDQQVSGISIRELKGAKHDDKIAINEVQPDGAKAVNEYHPDTLIVFLLPPSFDVWMQRLRGRGDIDDAELRRRLVSAFDEITEALSEKYYQFVINNEIHEAAQAVDELANGREPDPEKQQKGRDHAEQLALEVKMFLGSK
jgi:guanylate kinase